MEKFNKAVGNATLNPLTQMLETNTSLSDMAKEQKKVDWDKLIGNIQNQKPQPA